MTIRNTLIKDHSSIKTFFNSQSFARVIEQNEHGYKDIFSISRLSSLSLYPCSTVYIFRNHLQFVQIKFLMERKAYFLWQDRKFTSSGFAQNFVFNSSCLISNELIIQKLYFLFLSPSASMNVKIELLFDVTMRVGTHKIRIGQLKRGWWLFLAPVLWVTKLIETRQRYERNVLEDHPCKIVK